MEERKPPSKEVPDGRGVKMDSKEEDIDLLGAARFYLATIEERNFNCLALEILSVFSDTRTTF